MTDGTPPGPAKAARVVPQPTLQVVDGPLAGTVLRLEHDEGTIGRRDDNAYVLSEPSVSRVHAELVKQAGAFVLTDLGSSGGTTVNGEPVTGPRVLRHGDRATFGTVVCRFEDPAAMATGENSTVVMSVPEVETGPHLSPRQQEVLELIAEGLTNKEIGERLGITERTVKAYAQELYERLDVHNRAGAVAEAVKQGMLSDL